MTAVTLLDEAILQAFIIINSSIRLSLISPLPDCTMYTSSPRTDSPISTLKINIFFYTRHSKYFNYHNWELLKTNLSRKIRKSINFSVGRHSPCFEIAEFLRYNFSKIDTKAINNSLSKIGMRSPTKNFYVWHSALQIAIRLL